MTTKMQDGFWLGVDVGKFSVEACVAPCDARTSEWAKLRVASFTHDKDGMRALEKWLAASTGQGPCLGVCIESTGVYSQRFVHAIEELGLPEVSMVNPALPVAFRKIASEAAVQPPFLIPDRRGDSFVNVGWAVLLPKPAFARAGLDQTLKQRQAGPIQ